MVGNHMDLELGVMDIILALHHLFFLQLRFQTHMVSPKAIKLVVAQTILIMEEVVEEQDNEVVVQMMDLGLVMDILVVEVCRFS